MRILSRLWNRLGRRIWPKGPLLRSLDIRARSARFHKRAAFVELAFDLQNQSPHDVDWLACELRLECPNGVVARRRLAHLGRLPSRYSPGSIGSLSLEIALGPHEISVAESSVSGQNFELRVCLVRLFALPLYGLLADRPGPFVGAETPGENERQECESTVTAVVSA